MGTSLWIIVNTDNEVLCEVKEVMMGEELNEYRAELLGINGILEMVGIVKGMIKYRLEIKCDCVGALKSINMKWRYTSRNNPHADILDATNILRREGEGDIHGLHVKGHRDELREESIID